MAPFLPNCSPPAADWREELRSLAIDKKNLDKGLQSRGARAVSLVEYARRKKLYDPIAHALASTLNYEKSHFDKLVASLLPLMEKLTTGRTASLLSPELDDSSDWRPVFDWTSVINLGGIVYVGLDALSDYDPAEKAFQFGPVFAHSAEYLLAGYLRCRLFYHFPEMIFSLVM